MDWRIVSVRQAYCTVCTLQEREDVVHPMSPFNDIFFYSASTTVRVVHEENIPGKTVPNKPRSLESCGNGICGLPVQAVQLLSRAGVPYTDGVVEASGHNLGAIRLHTRDTVVVSFKLKYGFAPSLHVPNCARAGGSTTNETKRRRVSCARPRSIRCWRFLEK